MAFKRRAPRYKKKQAIRRRRGMKGRRMGFKGKQRYHGVKYIKETINKGVLTMPAGGGAFIEKFTCNLSEVSQTASFGGVSPFAALRSLYGRYCITGVKWTFIPLATQSVAGQQNVDRVCFAINRDPQDVLVGEQDIIRQDDCKFTNTARKFSVYVKHPVPVIASTANQTGNIGLNPTQYNQPTGGNPANPLPNQIATTLGGMKWIWLPTRTINQQDQQGNITSEQFPDHVGLDVVITSQQRVPLQDEYNVYTVYQTLYLAFKEQN